MVGRILRGARFALYRVSAIILVIFLTVIARELTAAYNSMAPNPRRSELLVETLVFLIPLFAPPLIAIIWAATYEMKRQWQAPGMEVLCIVLVPWTLLWINVINNL